MVAWSTTQYSNYGKQRCSWFCIRQYIYEYIQYMWEISPATECYQIKRKTGNCNDDHMKTLLKLTIALYVKWDQYSLDKPLSSVKMTNY
jgi:hypothetical protein